MAEKKKNDLEASMARLEEIVSEMENEQFLKAVKLAKMIFEEEVVYINGKIIINKKEKELINNIYNLYLNGYSMFQIANKLNKENTPTKRNGKWYQSTIKSILTNPLYIGKIRYGLHKKHKSFQVLGKQEKIISINKFNKVQKIIKEKRA